MSDSATTEATSDGHAEAHHGPNIGAYLAVFGALAICTLISFVANLAVRQEVMGAHLSFAIIMGVAVLKAVLVAMIFMHLKWDWKRVYIMIVPALILGPLLVIVLLPDIVLAWKVGVP
jgi:caa(3)-type oxidase subunit IV